MSKQKLHLGIIGAGRIGRVHAETLAFRLPEAQTVAITDVSQDAVQAVASRCGISRIAESALEIIADPQIEAVLICSPTPTHADLIVEAALAGKHIFCEKPMGTDATGIRRFMAAAKKSRELKLTVKSGAQRRSQPWYLDQYKRVKNGEIGDIVQMNANWVGTPGTVGENTLLGADTTCG